MMGTCFSSENWKNHGLETWLKTVEVTVPFHRIYSQLIFQTQESVQGNSEKGGACQLPPETLKIGQWAK